MILLSFKPAKSQVTFQKTFETNNDLKGRAIQQTTEGGYIIAGEYGIFDAKIYVSKIDSIGNLQWAKTYGGNNSYASVSSIKQTFDGGYIVSGQITNTFPLGYILKMDSLGNQTFFTTFGTYAGGDMHYNVTQILDSGYVVSGPSNWFGSASIDDVNLIKFDSNGGMIWSKNIFGNSNDEVNYSLQTSEGGFIFIGSTGSYGEGGNDILVLKTDTSGNISWYKTYGTASDEYGYSIQPTTDGGYIVAGGDQLSSCYILKIDNSGSVLWGNSYSNVEGNKMTIRETFDGNYIIGGGTGSSGSDVYLLKIDSFGNVIWKNNYGYTGGQNFDYGYSIEQTNDGGFIIIGMSDTTSGNGSDKTYLIKTDSSGITGCFENSGSSTSNPISFISNTINPTITSGISVNSFATSDSIISPIINTLCSSTGINTTMPDNSFTVFPNPSVGVFNIAFEIKIMHGTVEIYNVFGKCIFELNINNESQKEIKFNPSSKGIYFVKITTGTKYYMQKLIIDGH